MRRKFIIVPAIAGAAALAIIGGVSVSLAMTERDVTLIIDGASRALTVRSDTVADVLETEGITLRDHDVVLPTVDTKISDGLEISVSYGRPFTVTVDGEERVVWTTARTVDEALGFLNLDAADSKVSASRSAAIGRDGISVEVATAKDVTLVAGGTTQNIRLAGTVADVLAKAGVSKDSDDIVQPSITTGLTDGMEIRFVDVEVTESTKDVTVPFEKVEQQSSEMDEGDTKVTQEGVDGIRRETYTDTLHDGKLVKSEKKSEQVVKEAVDEVTVVGTRESADSPESTITGSKADWMAAAGIPESDWKYVDYIVTKESSWNPKAVNKSSGACGLVQALPCTKLGSNWSDPVVALKWQYQYVKDRYGGYEGAYQFWLRNHWY